MIDSFDSPGVSFKGSNGLTFDGVYLWVSEFYDKKIYKILSNLQSPIKSSAAFAVRAWQE